ncbi:anthranilate synthase component I [Idiomarina tyrosinivorans]|uniref:Anthranilate synthase component 1 n=2 Tax=Idiomarina tyrosinivorans TaxID=1445662 RepID=A0A432ZM39_9GAMM|nr:anthranilate synthase component I [Idiomarina tyrosinivorans]
MAIPYTADPLQLFATLAQQSNDCMLLESAEINSKKQLKSLLLVDPALKLICQGHTISVQAITTNGEVLLAWLATELQNRSTLFQVEQQSSSLQIEVLTQTPTTTLQDEQQRLLAPSNLEPLRALQQGLQKSNAAAQQHPLAVFLGGVFAYDLLATFEPLQAVPDGENSCPDYQFYLAETLVVIDHEQQTTELLGSLFSGPQLQQRRQQLLARLGTLAAHCQLRSDYQPAPQSVSNDIDAAPSAEQYADIVSEMKRHIRNGDIFQVVPSRRFSIACADSISAYRYLRQQNPSPYMFFLQASEFQLFGASPESALKFTAANRQVELYPIAGTRPRGKDKNGNIDLDLDGRLELDLRLDQKELSEHLMLVDLSRNDLARIAEPGTRYVADLLQVDRYSHVMHLVSRVVAKLDAKFDALHAYRACMNMGTLIGAPKVSAANLVRQAEKQRRGSYGGAVGYLTGNGDMDTCIVIRSAFVQNQRAIIQAGAGIVHDSIAASEIAETENKAQAVINAIKSANQELAL